jgi:DNA-binding LytR/AlgR family response regulator
VFEAYDVEAFQYLLKPVDDRKLKRVLQKAVLKTERCSREFIIVSSERQKKKVFLDDIYYFEIKGRVVDVHGPEGIFTYYEQIGELENKLCDKGFFRCHKSYLVNLKYVDVYNRREVTLENGERIVIAKRRYDKFVQEVLKVMRKNGGIL